MTERRLISSGSPYEPTIGFSRAVRVGNTVFVSGTSPIMPGDAAPPSDAYGQAIRCLEIIRDALERAGASMSDVVRTTTYLTHITAWEGVGKAHGEVFGEIRPASTMVVVSQLLDPRWLVEISADAVIGDE